MAAVVAVVAAAGVAEPDPRAVGLRAGPDHRAAADPKPTGARSEAAVPTGEAPLTAAAPIGELPLIVVAPGAIAPRGRRAPERKRIGLLRSAHPEGVVSRDRRTGQAAVTELLPVVRAVDPQAGEQVTVLALVRRPVQDQAVGPVIVRPSVAVPDRVIGPTSGAGPPSFPPIAPAQATGRPDPASFPPIVPAGAIGWDNDLLLVTVQAPAAVIALPLYRLRVPIWVAGEEWAEAALRRLEPGLPAAHSAQVLPTGWVTDRERCPGWATGVDDLVSCRRTVRFRTGVKVFKTG